MQSPQSNPFKMGEQNKAKDKACSIPFKAPLGPDRIMNQHYKTTHSDIESRGRSSTELRLLPVVQPKVLAVERDFNSRRNTKVSVAAVNPDSRPLVYSDSKIKEPLSASLIIEG